jgi:hypothetical protein
MLEVIDGTRAAEHAVALVVAHRGTIRIIANRHAGVEPMIELGSIHILQCATPDRAWRATSIDIVEHLIELG